MEGLKKYGLEVKWNKREGGNSDDPDDYLPIDFTIEDGDYTVATVWGTDPENDLEIECEHPEEFIEFGDDEDECGECKICGAQCDWHWTTDVVDEGHDEDGVYFARTGKVREITNWYNVGGSESVIGEYLKQISKKDCNGTV